VKAVHVERRGVKGPGGFLQKKGEERGKGKYRLERPGKSNGNGCGGGEKGEMKKLMRKLSACYGYLRHQSHCLFGLGGLLQERQTNCKGGAGLW